MTYHVAKLKLSQPRCSTWRPHVGSLLSAEVEINGGGHYTEVPRPLTELNVNCVERYTIQHATAGSVPACTNSDQGSEEVLTTTYNRRGTGTVVRQSDSTSGHLLVASRIPTYGWRTLGNVWSALPRCQGPRCKKKISDLEEPRRPTRNVPV